MINGSIWGGQLISERELDRLKNGIKKGNLKNWDEIHREYWKIGERLYL